MTGWLKITRAVFWIALIAWISVLTAAAVAASNVFPTLKNMPMTLEEYAAFDPGVNAQGAEATESAHGMLAAGMIMEGVFTLANMVQFVAAPIVIITLLLEFGLFGVRFRRPANIIRMLCVAVAATLFAWHGFVQYPRMTSELRAYWADARAGNATEAILHETRFNQDHPLAQRLMEINLMLLVVTVIASAASTVERPRSVVAITTSALETPRLAR